MAKFEDKTIIKDGRPLRIRVGRKELLIEKIQKAGNWNRKLRKLTTKELTSYCGKGN